MNTRFFLAPASLCAIAFLSAGCPSSNTENTNSSSVPSSSNSGARNSSSSSNSSSGNSATTSTGTVGTKKFKLAFVTNNTSDFWVIARKGVDKAAKELNTSVEFQIPPKGQAAEQSTIIADLLSKGVEGIAMSPIDPANQTDLINSAGEKGVVFTQDSDAPKSNRACYIGTDNMAAGRQAGAELKKALPNGGKVMIFVGKTDVQNAADRINGMKEAIKGSKIVVLGVRTDNADHTKAKSNVSDELVRTPDLAACVGIWSYNGPQILGAVKDAGRKNMKIVCFDEEADTLSGIKSGDIAATIVQQPYQFGYLSVINMNKWLNGDKAFVPASKQIFVPTKIIDKTNVDAFSAELKKLTGK